MVFTFEFAPNEYLTVESRPEGAIRRSAPPVYACGVQLVPFQEDIDAEEHQWRRRKYLSGSLPDEVKEYIAENEWVNNFFMRDGRHPVWLTMAFTPVCKRTTPILFYVRDAAGSA